MLIFWIIVALFLAGALLLLLPPLLSVKRTGAAPTAAGVNLAVHRDQLREAERDLALDAITPERFALAKAEIERQVLQDARQADVAAAATRPARRMALALGLLIPLAAVLGYLALGQPQALRATAPVAPSADARHATTPEQIQKMVATLSQRLQTEPNNVEGWAMLGRSYTALGRHRDAAQAFKRATELAPNNANLLADYADLLGMAQGKRLAGEPARLIQRALDVDPRHVKALALAGSVAFEVRDHAAAVGYWQRLLDIVPPESDMARSVRGSIAQARQLEGAAATTPKPAAAGLGALTGTVSISPELAAKVNTQDTLFVFARAAQGPRAPLAILRRPASELPLAFSLDDSMAMAPDLKLSGYAQVVIGARISKSGNATPQPGDLLGSSAPVAAGAQGVRITIDQVAP